MLSSMMASSQVNGKDWPALGGKPPENPEGNDWELLDPTDESSTDTNHDVVLVGTDRVKRQLRHCASSPNLNHYDILEAVEEEVDDEERPKDDSSFAMVSGPKSVISVSSGFSFRDAILSPPKNGEDQLSNRRELQAPTQSKRRTVKPKFVVKPIRRCSKSTGDLQSLNRIAEDEEILGDSDAMDFYHRKAAGVRNRTSGLKMRPDELKRKQITMYKKAQQKSKNG